VLAVEYPWKLDGDEHFIDVLAECARAGREEQR
jgi:hypothetical protein